MISNTVSAEQPVMRTHDRQQCLLNNDAERRPLRAGSHNAPATVRRRRRSPVPSARDEPWLRHRPPIRAAQPGLEGLAYLSLAGWAAITGARTGH
jgi:hypothetical protein